MHNERTCVHLQKLNLQNGKDYMLNPSKISPLYSMYMMYMYMCILYYTIIMPFLSFPHQDYIKQAQTTVITNPSQISARLVP